MDMAEVEFLAEKDLVTIIPNFNLDKIYLTGVGTWGLLTVEKLEKMRNHERKEETFTPVPGPYYMELTKLLLNHASDNIPKADEIWTLVKDMWDTRIAKLRVSADSFVRQQEAHAKLDHLTLMEINTSRTVLTQVLSHMYKLRTNLQPSESTQSQDF
uniref:GINS complex subunit 2 n=1 Tax=Mandrillus leucophaeus TaxID=9568 RepID=A0A2K6A3K2_MANLE